MHLEILVEDSSGAVLLSQLMAKLIGPLGEPHTWRLHSYRGLGRFPRDLGAASDPAKRSLLEQLPRLLRGYARTSGIDVVVVVVDTDTRDCAAFLTELKQLAEHCGAGHLALFRLAIEEVEAWYLGDRKALLAAYPGAREPVLRGYVQDSICGTWELLAAALAQSARNVTRGADGRRAGDLKHEWARRIGPLMDPDNNFSPSFGKFRDGVRRRVGALPPSPGPSAPAGSSATHPP